MLKKKDVLPKELENAIQNYLQSMKQIAECQIIFDKYCFQMDVVSGLNLLISQISKSLYNKP
jgi:hypothetical protein